MFFFKKALGFCKVFQLWAFSLLIMEISFGKSGVIEPAEGLVCAQFAFFALCYVEKYSHNN